MIVTDPLARLGQTGVGLDAAALAWGRRPSSPQRIALTSRDRQILLMLYELGYLTTTMLALLFWGKQTTAANVRLKLLHDVGYVDRFRPRVARTDGSHEWIYRLTERGWLDIVSRDRPDAKAAFAPAKLVSPGYIEHDLQLNALLVHLAVLAAQPIDSGSSQGLLDRIPFQILGPRTGTVNPATECPAARASAASDLSGRLAHPETAVPGLLVPDATLIGSDAYERRTAVMIEYDRTGRAHKQISKWTRYDHFLTSGWRTTRYANLDLEPLVLFVCAHETHLPAFVRSADKHLNAWLGPVSALRGDGEHAGREQVAFTSRGRLLSSDWRMTQVPPLPPAYRSAPVFPNRETELELPSLFA